MIVIRNLPAGFSALQRSGEVAGTNRADVLAPKLAEREDERLMTISFACAPGASPLRLTTAEGTIRRE